MSNFKKIKDHMTITYDDLGDIIRARTNVGEYLVVIHQKYTWEEDYHRRVEFVCHEADDSIVFENDFNEGQEEIKLIGIFDIDDSLVFSGTLLLRGV